MSDNGKTDGVFFESYGQDFTQNKLKRKALFWCTATDLLTAQNYVKNSTANGVVPLMVTKCIDDFKDMEDACKKKPNLKQKILKARSTRNAQRNSNEVIFCNFSLSTFMETSAGDPLIVYVFSGLEIC